jgi:raffinose/stachyose/melibiose transport system substrate-binding protein
MPAAQMALIEPLNGVCLQHIWKNVQNLKKMHCVFEENTRKITISVINTAVWGSGTEEGKEEIFMKRNSKVLSVLVASAMTAGMLAGCGSSTASSTAASSASAASSAASASSTSSADSAAKETSAASSSSAAEAVSAESTASSGAVDTSASKSIKILAIWAEDSTEGKIINELTQKYIDEVNPNFSYEYEYVAQTDLSTKISTLVASDDLPDVFVYSAGKPLQQLIEADKVVDISDALDATGESDALLPAAKSSLLSLSNTDDLYDLPFGLNIEGFWYNKSVFEKAGVDVPTTWDELLDVCDKLKSQGIQPLATGGADKWPTTRLVNAYAYRSMGADAVKKASNGEAKFTDDGYVKAAQMVADMASKGYFGEGATTVDNTTAEGMLLNGQCAMLYDGSWFSSSIADPETNPDGEDNIGFMGVPVVDESVSPATEYPTNCGNVFCLSKEKYDAATAGWLQYFVSNIGNYAMENYQSIRGYKYDTDDSQLGTTVKAIVDDINSATGATAWWEAYMDDQTKAAAQDNIQNVLNGDMDGQQYCESIQEAYDLAN